MASKINPIKPTFESVWAALQETDRILTFKFAETDRKMQETAAEIKKVNQTLGAWANNQGLFAEEYFYNSFEKGQTNFFGEKFDRISKNLPSIEAGYKDEYDIVLFNGKSVAIIEVKSKAHINDIPNVLRKSETFRGNFPKYENYKIYLGLASLAFYPELEEECLKNGLAIIKQVGDSVVINDTALIAY